MTVPVQGIGVCIAPTVLLGNSGGCWYSPREVLGLFAGPQVVLVMIGTCVILRK